MLTLVFGIFPRHCAGGVHQFMYMDNLVDLLDNDSDAAASASTLVAAASVAAAEAGVQASVSPNGTGCHWLPRTHGPARSRGAAA
jgi:hypothetical protein